MSRYVLVVHTRPLPGRADEFNQWYDEIHLSEVLRVPDFVGARRWVAESLTGADLTVDTARDGTGTDDAVEPSHLAVYEIDTDDIGSTLAVFNRQRAHMSTTTALDRDSVSFSLYRVR